MDFGIDCKLCVETVGLFVGRYLAVARQWWVSEVRKRERKRKREKTKERYNKTKPKPPQEDEKDDDDDDEWCRGGNFPSKGVCLFDL